MTEEPVRIGVLGAARIVRGALLQPSTAVRGVEVVAIAARDPDRAAGYAAKHRIPRVHSSYAELLDDPDIDAVYVPMLREVIDAIRRGHLQHPRHSAADTLAVFRTIDVIFQQLRA
ncbi:Gfo/Idh/MocA family oxidoreductase [Agromyces albus]|uniref:Gfo/Idh/MocA-like oxidoreductase N-terminal domain-containing protein n=1 Tax=Agromyces albus TaxID=205332 RepID=A0A4Q2L4K2_9MICO|nr:Gfo/Idh/MocA family oxidoreductase [Agromyces albus]RXZ72529.1 hypothetical protein ESP51_03435 [Agromyces albus]